MSEAVFWQSLNQLYLNAALDWVRARLGVLISDQITSVEISEHPAVCAAAQAVVEAEATLRGHKQTSSFEQLGNVFALSQFEQQVLMLGAAAELSGDIAAMCEQIQGTHCHRPAYSLAFELFESPDWGATSPYAALQYWLLMMPDRSAGQSLVTAPLVMDDRIVSYIKGLNYLDSRLSHVLMQVATPDSKSPLPPSQKRIAGDIAELLRHSGTTAHVPQIRLSGPDSVSKELVAACAVDELGFCLYRISSGALPAMTADLDRFARLWARESRLLPLALFIVTTKNSMSQSDGIKQLVSRAPGIYFVDADNTSGIELPNECVVDVAKPKTLEQREIWCSLLGNTSDEYPAITEQFSFNQKTIAHLARQAFFDSSDTNATKSERLWRACRQSARLGLDRLAQRIDAKATWDELILPTKTTQLLKEISSQVKNRNTVYSQWGFRDKISRGLGISALFAGESGTGKTHAAEVIANELNLDLYRIDLSAVISKYIGETPKNVKKIFDAAEANGAILFFDEADALFGKRSEVKDSRDRHANVEISYLLQRMESYCGLAVMATNFRKSLDHAFVRRLRFIVPFEFPSHDARAAIWTKVFPKETPLSECFDAQRLADLQLTGGSIHNIALNACFLAAQQNQLITMPLILAAARMEYDKLQKPGKESLFSWAPRHGKVAYQEFVRDDSIEGEVA